MSFFPLPPVPNFKVISSEQGLVRLIWADYPPEVKDGHILKGFRIYRSDTKDMLGKRIADEFTLGPAVFQFDDTSPEAGPTRHYVCVGVEESGYGKSSFGKTPYGELDSTGFSLHPYNTRPFGSPLRGWGEAPYGAEAYGF
jgi:hypothetical protein